MDALVSFSFNVGLGTLQRSTLRQKHNRGDYKGAAEEFLKYTKAGGKVLKGLVNRRNDERALYLGG
jgi:lysozyme